MASQLHVGSIIHYTPIRLAFAKTTGSNQPSDKKRPCVVLEVTMEGVTITPLCGARRISSTEWGRGEAMVPELWHPVRFTNSELPVAFDGIAATRDPFIVTHEPSLPRPEFYGGPKPSYIWVGDKGEWVTPAELLTADRIDPYISMSSEEINKIKKQQEYWHTHPLAP